MSSRRVADHDLEHDCLGFLGHELVQREAICAASQAVPAQQNDCLVEEVEGGVIQQWVGNQQARLLWHCLQPDLPQTQHVGQSHGHW